MPSDIRRLEATEVETLVRWAKEEGWNPGNGDASAFQAADPDGFLGSFVDGRMVSGISAVRYGNTFGFIGLYITVPAWRGRGYGRAVWDAGMALLAGRTVGLDGVPAQQTNYARMGFVTAHQTQRFIGRLAGGVDPDIRSDAPAESIAAFDATGFPEPRPAFLSCWLRPPRVVRVLVQQGHITGYGVARPCAEGGKVGPLFARDTEGALRLLDALCAALPVALAVDVPAYQADFAAALAARGFVPGFATARMYRGPAPTFETSRVFGISTLELG